MLFIMEWGVVHIGGGCSFERNYGETFHRNCYYRGKGIGFPFYQYWVFVCQMNYTHSISSSMSKESFFLSIEGHIEEEADILLLRASFSQFCGVTDEEWCSRYLWVISFGAVLPHTAPSIMDWARASQQAGPPRILGKHFQSQMYENICVNVFPNLWSTNSSLYANTAFLTFLAWEIFTFCPFPVFFAATSF